MPQDYLIRLIEQVGQMLASVLAYKEAGKTAEAREEIASICLRTLGLSLAAVKVSSPESLRKLLESGGGLRHVRGVLLAELLLRDADFCEEAGNLAEAVAAQLQAFCLLGESIPLLSSAESAIYAPKLALIAGKLKRVEHVPYVKEKLRAHGFGG